MNPYIAGETRNQTVDMPLRRAQSFATGQLPSSKSSQFSFGYAASTFASSFRTQPPPTALNQYYRYTTKLPAVDNETRSSNAVRQGASEKATRGVSLSRMSVPLASNQVQAAVQTRNPVSSSRSITDRVGASGRSLVSVAATLPSPKAAPSQLVPAGAEAISAISTRRKQQGTVQHNDVPHASVARQQRGVLTPEVSLPTMERRERSNPLSQEELRSTSTLVAFVPSPEHGRRGGASGLASPEPASLRSSASTSTYSESKYLSTTFQASSPVAVIEGVRSRANQSPHLSPPTEKGQRTEPSSGNSANPRGLVGLVNMGNTCFLNSVLQCLSNLPQLTDIFAFSTDWKSRVRIGSRASVALAFGDLMQKIWKGQSFSVEKPAQLKAAVAAASPRFHGYDQQDAQEFLRVLVDSLHEDTIATRGSKPYREMEDPSHQSDSIVAEEWWNYHKERDSSAIAQVFAGQLHSVVECCVCKHKSRAFDPFWDLSVPIPKSNQTGEPCGLIDCLAAFACPEKLSGSDSVYCRNCKKHQDSIKSIRIFRSPPVLVFHLKRFAFSTYRRSKISSRVDLPSTLNISRYISSDGSSGSSYRLVGVVNHFGGGLQSGHYTADCINRDDGKWYNFNDSRVSSSSGIDGGAAYLAFYSKS